ncbi:MAG: 1-acyl-sn-glycerol-3-phosphate acyltransferase [Gammaproteobacteria bacterium]|nr:1-acyl-sn-glycerol-3-phosphate acyltransferase [Gammaproteobacteria bacterium]
MTRIFKIIRLFGHVITGFYLYIRYFYRTNPELQGFSSHQLALIKQWFDHILNILNIKVISSLNMATDKPKIYVSNHISWLDIIVIGHILSLRFIAKSEIANWPMISRLAAKSGTIFIRRGKISDLTKISQRVKQVMSLNESVAFFPEGKTSEGHSILPIYSGLFQVAIDTGANVIPLILSYDDGCYPAKKLPFVGEQSFMANVWAVTGVKRIKVYLDCGQEISPESKTRKVIANEVSQKMSAVLLKRFAS